MARNTLVINCDLRETRVALIEDGVIAELQIERANQRGTVGNIVLGKVSRVLPGMQAAFIDVGMERAAFLHVEDLIRPDDFEAYLAGDFQEEFAKSAKGEAGKGKAEEEDDDEDDEVLVKEADVEGDDDEHDHDHVHAEAPDSGEDEDDEDEDEDDEDDLDDEGEDEDEDDLDDEDDEDDLDDEDDDEEAEAVAEAPSEVEVETPRAVAPTRRASVRPSARPPAPEAEEEAPASPKIEEEEEEENGNGGGRRRRRRRRKGGGEGGGSGESRNRRPEGRRKESRKESRNASRGSGGGGEGRRKQSSRVSRSVPITEVVKEGDKVVVQISKEPIGTKGARVTSHVSLPGRYCVYLPTVDHVGISKRIGSPKERSRLRKVIEGMKPKSGGIIVRTVAQGLTKKALKADLGYLIRLWGDVSKKVEEGGKAPLELYAELDLVLKTARDLFTDDIETIVIDDRDQYARLVRFVEMFLPERVRDIELYEGDEPIFDAYGIEDEIARALSRKVPLPSGGYLIMDQAEALSAIDVNTGRFVGKGSKDLEETALKTNLEAVEEIAYQLRFRNVGGLVVLDLIDMEASSNRDKVYRALENALKKDKAKTTINRISELGLIEMTRKRTRESLSRTMHEPCFYCDGTGQIQSRSTIAYEILRQIRREKSTLPGYNVLVNAHPAIVDLLQGEERDAVKDAERRYQRRIRLMAHKEYHIEQFDLKGE